MEYWPFLFGVADLNPPSPLPLPLSPFAPGYALKPASALRCDCEAYGELLLTPAPYAGYGALRLLGAGEALEAAEDGRERVWASYEENRAERASRWWNL